MKRGLFSRPHTQDYPCEKEVITIKQDIDIPIVLFDDNCSLCRSLAIFLHQRTKGSISVSSWQEFSQKTDICAEWQQKKADKLRVYIKSSLLEGEEAWQFILNNYEDIAPLRWLAQKLGLEKKTATLLNKGGNRIRKLFCRRCG